MATDSLIPFDNNKHSCFLLSLLGAGMSSIIHRLTVNPFLSCKKLYTLCQLSSFIGSGPVNSSYLFLCPISSCDELELVGNM